MNINSNSLDANSTNSQGASKGINTRQKPAFGAYFFIAHHVSNANAMVRIIVAP